MKLLGKAPQSEIIGHSQRTISNPVGASPGLAVLLPSLAGLTPFAPLVSSLYHRSPTAYPAPTARPSNFTKERGAIGHKTPHLPAFSLRMHVLSCCWRKSFSISVRSSEYRGLPPPHPPVAITLLPPSKAHLLSVSNYPFNPASAPPLLLPSKDPSLGSSQATAGCPVCSP